MSIKSLMSAVVVLRPELDLKQLDKEVRKAGGIMERDLEDAGERGGKKAGKEAGDGVASGVRKGTDAATKDLSAFGSKAGKMFSGMQSAGAKMSIGVTAPLLLIGKLSIDQAQEAEKAQKRQAAIWKAMGGEQSAAALQAEQQAIELGRQIAVDNDEISAVQAKAATFRELWADSATGVQTFNRTVAAAFDMQAAGFGDAEGNIVMLAKAISDPEMANALKRTGALTSAQADAITALAKANKPLEAQQALLIAIESQVKGTASEMVTDIDRATVEWQDMQEEIGKELVPVLTDVLSVVKDLMGWFKGLPDGTRHFIIMGGVIAGLVGPLLAVIGTVGKLGMSLVGLAGRWGAVGVAAGEAAAMQQAAAMGGVPVGGKPGKAGAIARGAGTAGALLAIPLAGQYLSNAQDPTSSEAQGLAGAWMNLSNFFTGNWGDIGHVPGVQWQGEQVPGMARGGLVDRAGLSWVGENGPELMDMPKGARVTPLDKVGGGVTFNAPVTIVANDPQQLFKELDRLSRRGGATIGTRRIP